MEPFFYGYLGLWVTACLITVALTCKAPAEFSFLRPEYRDFLLVKWKLATFAIATCGLTLIAPYTGDPTWDYFDALYMSALTFLGAPWAIGIVYRAAIRRASLRQLYVAICIWMFSASRSYDLYILARDGNYPVTWLPNIFASSILYLCAGLLWNLDFRPGRGVIFSFMESDWPLARPAAFRNLVWYAAPFMLMVVAAVLYFIVPN